MDQLESIPIDVDPASALTGNLLPLLHELRHALRRFTDAGTSHTIDLSSLPMAPEEQRQLQRILGEGEVRASLQALGSSNIAETAIPGIWSITHYNGDEKIVGRFLEVTDCPSLLKSQHQDLADGIDRLEQLILEQSPESVPG